MSGISVDDYSLQLQKQLPHKEAAQDFMTLYFVYDGAIGHGWNTAAYEVERQDNVENVKVLQHLKRGRDYLKKVLVEYGGIGEQQAMQAIRGYEDAVRQLANRAMQPGAAVQQGFKR